MQPNRDLPICFIILYSETFEACEIPVPLCDTAVPMALRKFFLENTGFGSTCQICVEHDEILMLFSKFYQCISIAVSGCNFLYF